MGRLLTPEIEAMVGTEATYTAPEELGRASIRYFARATGDDNPIYLDQGAAEAAGHPTIVAPPTLVCETNQYVDGRRDEHGYAGHLWELDVPGTQLIRGGNRYEFHRPVYASDRITAHWTIAEIKERIGSDGLAMLFVVSEATYSNQDGELLAVNRETNIYRERARPVLDVASLSQGTSLPDLQCRIELPDMVVYGAATWDWHRLHYDANHAAALGLPGPVVDGQVFGAYLARQLTDAFGPRAFIKTMEFRFRSMVFAGETITCHATVTSVEATAGAILIEVDQYITVGDRIAVAPATAEVLVHG